MMTETTGALVSGSGRDAVEASAPSEAWRKIFVSPFNVAILHE
jgi:hypothetical protein